VIEIEAFQCGFDGCDKHFQTKGALSTHQVRPLACRRSQTP
jgi:hypothetical protein